MFQLAVYGVNNHSAMVKKVIEEYYSSVSTARGGEAFKVAAFFDVEQPETRVFDDTAVLDFEQTRAMYQKGALHAVIVPREQYCRQSYLAPQLIHNGINIEDLYITNRLDLDNFSDDDLITFLTPYLSAKYLPYLEFHIADHCNLNCKACEHYSGLVSSPSFPVLEKFAKDLERFRGFIDDIGQIRILGGEPLLNPEIEDYIRLSRRLYPLAFITVVTNALLLDKMPESFFETVKEQNAEIHISRYLPVEKKFPQTQKLLRDKGVKFTYSPLMKQFEMKQTLEKSETPDYFYRCYQARCHNLYEGKIAACFLPFTTKYFNEYFNQNLPEDGAIDLYDDTLTTEILKAKLLEPFERCRYCADAKKVKWEQVKKPSDLSDWIKAEN